MSFKKVNRLVASFIFIFLFSLITTIVLGTVSGNRYQQDSKQIEFLEEVEQSATVDAATDALERGMPFLEKHFAGSMELRILQSNLDYLKQQPPQTLVPPAIKESISTNGDRIHDEFTENEPWDSIFLVSIWAFFFSATILLCLLSDPYL